MAQHLRHPNDVAARVTVSIPIPSADADRVGGSSVEQARREADDILENAGCSRAREERILDTSDAEHSDQQVALQHGLPIRGGNVSWVQVTGVVV